MHLQRPFFRRLCLLVHQDLSKIDEDFISIFKLIALALLWPKEFSCRWDFCFYQGSVVEHLDGHADIIHKQLTSNWLPWSESTLRFFTQLALIVSYFRILQVNSTVIIYRGMKRRDLLLRRYWRREDDGTYGTSVLGNMWISSSLESHSETDSFSFDVSQ